MYRLLLLITSVLIKFILKPVSCKYVSLNDTSNAQNGVVPEPKNTCITYRMLQLKSVERNGGAAVQERKENVFLFHMRSQDDWKSFDKRKNIGGLLTCTYKGKRSLNRNRILLQKRLDFRASLRKAINFHSKTSGMSALKWINLFEIPTTNKNSMYSVLVVNKDWSLAGLRKLHGLNGIFFDPRINKHVACHILFGGKGSQIKIVPTVSTEFPPFQSQYVYKYSEGC